VEAQDHCRTLSLRRNRVVLRPARPDLDQEQRKASLLEFLKRLTSYGVTGLVDAAGGGCDAAVYDPVFSLWRENRLPVRIAFRISAQTPENEPSWYKKTLAPMCHRHLVTKSCILQAWGKSLSSE